MKEKVFKKQFQVNLEYLVRSLNSCLKGDLSFEYCIPLLFRFCSRYLWCHNFNEVYKKR